MLLCLSLGTAAAATTASFVQSLAWPKAPHAVPTTLFEVYEDRFFVESDDRDRFISNTTLSDVIERRALAGAAGVRSIGTPFPHDSELASCGAHLLTTGDFFRALSARPLLGRLYTVADESNSTQQPIVISRGCWLRAFGGDSAIVGRSFAGRSASYNIVGVLPSEFSFPLQSSAQIFLLATPTERKDGFELMIGRIPEESSSSAKAALEAIARVRGPEDQMALVERLRSSHVSATPATAGPRFVLRPYRGEPLDPTSRRLLVFVLVCAGLVVGVTMSNAATLCAARVIDRRRELAMRVAIGASQIKIFLSVLIEGCTIVAIAAPVGALIAAGFLKLMQSTLRLSGVNVDVGLRALPTGMIIVLITLLWGLLAALVANGSRSTAFLRHGVSEGTNTASPRLLRLQERLVAGQIAIATSVVAAWSLSAFEFAGAAKHARDLTDGISIATVAYPSGVESQRDAAMRDVRQTHDNLQRAGLSLGVGQHPAQAQIRKIQVRTGGQGTTSLVWLAGTSSNYGTLLHQRIIRGRAFTADEERTGAHVAVVDVHTASALFGTSDPLGKKVELRDGSIPLLLTVIGVSTSLQVLQSFGGQSRALEIRVPWTVLADPPRTMVAVGLRQGTSLAAVASAAAVPGTSLRLSRADELMVGRGALHQLLTQLFTLFGCAALALTAVGTYSLIAVTAAQRRRAIAIHVALGASTRAMTYWIMRQHIRSVSTGVALGLGLTGLATVAATKGVALSFERVSPLLLGSAVVLTTLIVFVAALVPAQSAAARPAMDVLRQD